MSEGGEEFRRNKGHQLRDEGTNRGNGNGSSKVTALCAAVATGEVQGSPIVVGKIKQDELINHP